MTKVCSLTEAIAEYVHDGETVFCAGFTHLIPFAAGHEIIRQGKRNLTLARATPDLIYDQMVAAGCAKNSSFPTLGTPVSDRCASYAKSWKPGALNGRNIPTLV